MSEMLVSSIYFAQASLNRICLSFIISQLFITLTDSSPTVFGDTGLFLGLTFVSNLFLTFLPPLSWSCVGCRRGGRRPGGSRSVQVLGRGHRAATHRWRGATSEPLLGVWCGLHPGPFVHPLSEAGHASHPSHRGMTLDETQKSNWALVHICVHRCCLNFHLQNGTYTCLCPLNEISQI